jgi:hypothetical protein
MIQQPDLTRVEKEIINYLRDNAGSSKADIIRHIRSKQMGSRMTVLEYIKDLENNNMIYGKKERPDSQSYMMYINEDNELLTVLTTLEEFKEAYVSLLEKSKEKINSLDLALTEADLSRSEEEEGMPEHERAFLEYEREMAREFKEMKDIAKQDTEKARSLVEEWVREYQGDFYLLTFTPIELFYEMVDLVFFRSMIMWPSKIKDEGVVAQTYLITYKKITEIQQELSRFIESTIFVKYGAYNTIQILVGGRYDKRSDLWLSVEMYKGRDMGLEIQRIADSLTRLNKGIENLKLLHR